MKKILLFAFPMLLASFIAGAQTVYYTQDFESGLPSDWTTTGQWQLTNAAGIASQYFAPPAHTMFMGFNDDGLGNGVVANGRVTTGPIDLTAASGSLVLYFDSYFLNGDYQGDETGKISVSTDAGATWTLITSVESANWEQKGAVLPYAGQTIWLAFDYDDGGSWNYGWCFDNVKISSPTISRDASFAYLNEESYVTGGVVGAEVFPGGGIKNNGVETITSVDMTWSDGTNNVTETFSGLNIPFGGSALLKSSTPFVMAQGTSNITVSISNVNGMGDDEDLTNDASNSFSLTSFTPNPDKGVVVEEATGTWCQWCPRGAVYLELMGRRYPNSFVGVAVHNNDPMVLAAYNAGVTAFPGFPGFPSVLLNRESILDPSEIEAPYQASASQAPPARLEVGAVYDDATRLLKVSVGAEFLESIGAGYKLNAIVIQDGVTGTGNSYAQVNVYSGGGPGEMGGYEVLPNPVPANMMVYNHVGRALLGGFAGATGSLPDAATAGQVFGYTFPDYTIPASYNVDNIHIVGVITNAAGEIVNAKEASLDEAVANGLFVSGTKEVVNNDMISVSPNPFTTTTKVSLNLETYAQVSMQVYDAVGKLVAEKNYGELSGAQVLTVDGTDLSAGMYFIHVHVGDTVATKRVYLDK